MTYSVHLIKLFIRRDDHLFKLNEAEKLKNVWNLLFFLLALTLLTFVWTAWLGLGTDAISANMTELTRADYELRKAWFLIGRAAYGLLFFYSFYLSLRSFTGYSITYPTKS